MSEGEKPMHTDEGKKLDKRNIERSIKGGLITKKEYESYLSKLPDISDKVFDPEEEPEESEEAGSAGEEEGESPKRVLKKKFKVKGK
jgi:hypothetical protein